MRILNPRIVLVLVLATLTTTLAGLGCGKTQPLDDPSAAEAPKEDRAAARAPNAPAGAATDYLKDATAVPAKLKAKVGGPVRLLELTLHPDHGAAQIQDPKKHENVDEYDLRDGQVGDPAPVQFSSPAPAAKDLDEATFDLASVDFAAVPRMAKETLVQLKIDDGKVTHMILKRGRPFNNDVRWRVYVNGTRKSGSVEFDPAGKLTKVWN